MSLRRLWLAGLLVLGAASLAASQESTTTAGPAEVTEKTKEEPEVKTKPPLTGNPQIDYKYDPNLPHEVIGYDLSEYPFYSRLPPDLKDPKFNFTCDDRHDGFYASVRHKCQVYHNCIFGVRYDFLCANYTVFDQKNFICHYVSEVDCINSEKHYDRNDELYETTTTTTTTRAPSQVVYKERPTQIRIIDRKPPTRRPPKRRTTTTTTQEPLYYDDYDYYDDYYNPYYDDYYYNDYAERTTTTTTTTTQRPPRRRKPPRRGGGDGFRGGNRNRKRPGPGGRGAGPRPSRLRLGGNPRDQGPPRGNPRRPSGRPGRPRNAPTTEAPVDYYYNDYEYDYVDEKSTTTAAPTTRRGRPRGRANGTGSRGRQGRPESTVATTTTQAPQAKERSDSRGRPSRVTTRVQPLAKVSQADQEEVIAQPQRSGRPQFPSRRTQGAAQAATLEAEIVEEEAPLAPGVRLSSERAQSDRADPQRRPRPDRQGNLRPSGRRRVPARNTAPDYDEY